MGCDHFTFADWPLGFSLAVMMTFVGGMGLRRPARLWYWLEWLAWKQDQWWLGYRADPLEDPGERVREALATYPQAIRIIQFVSGSMLLVSIPALAVFLYLLIRRRACL